MSLRPPIIAFEQAAMEQAGLSHRGLDWCELGNQRVAGRPAAETYRELGVANHLSIDLNGRDGALALDLDHPVPFVFRERFDVVTNYGTSEHVNAQHQVFENAHSMCRAGGLMIHVVPHTGHWPGHCRYYYTREFAEELAQAAGYDIIALGVLDQDNYAAPRNLLSFALRKTEQPFPDAARFEAIGGLTDTGDLRKTGDYNRRRLKYKLRAIRDIVMGASAGAGARRGGGG